MERLLLRRTVDEVTQCWNWAGALNEKGYGLINVNKRARRVHRLAYAAAKGAIPTGLMVCHTCDNPRCFNPDHLFIGTALDNNRDRENKGRGADRHGERHPGVKLSDAEVLEIQHLGVTTTLRHREIAARYGVTRARISQLMRGERSATTRSV